MRDRAVVLVDDVDDVELAEAAGVERLAAGGGIKRGPIERDAEVAPRRSTRVTVASKARRYGSV
jgi:hypothetical protein